MELELQKFIRNNADWRAKISAAPYCISVSEDEVFGRKLMLFKYSQYESDFGLRLVRECRGIILDAETFEVVTFPFIKFHNYGEVYADDIDWKSCYVTEKLDGSLTKIVRLGDELLISTNGTVDAFKAPLAEQLGCTARSFGDLIVEAICNAYISATGVTPSYKSTAVDWLKNQLTENMTYMFELTSPFNEVIVHWDETKLNFIGCRDNKTGKEIFFGDHPLAKVFNTPKVYPLRSVDECVEAAKKLGDNEEGYVVVDKDFNRVKIKSPHYVELHHLAGNGIMTAERAIEIIRKNEVAEVLSYFPKFKPAFDEINAKIDSMRYEIDNHLTELRVKRDKFESRKDAAIWIKNEFGKYAGIGFAYLDGKINSADDWFDSVPVSRLADTIKENN